METQGTIGGGFEREQKSISIKGYGGTLGERIGKIIGFRAAELDILGTKCGGKFGKTEVGQKSQKQVGGKR